MNVHSAAKCVANNILSVNALILVEKLFDQLLQQCDSVIESMNKTFIAPKIDMKC